MRKEDPKHLCEKMKVLFIVSEMEPLAKVGGLADVIGALSRRLSGLKCDLRVAIPFYKQVKKNLNKLKIKPKKLKESVTVCIDWLPVACNIYKLNLDRVTVYLIENDELYKRDQIYATRKGEFEDNDLRFGFLSLSSLGAAKALNFKPDIIHCHDWQGAFVPIFLKWRKHLRDDDFFKNSKIVFTVHNVSYQGTFAKDILERFGLPIYLFTPQGLELHGKANLLKGGIIYSHMVTTVSPTYAEELKKREYAYGMEAVFKWITRKSNNFVGILNGIDFNLWNPDKDPSIYENYSYARHGNKTKNKELLKKELGLEPNKSAPLLGIVSKLTEQKGIDLLIDALPQILDLGYQVVVIGKGELRYERLLRKARRRYNRNVSLTIGINDTLERRIYAGSDMFIMPSRFEPCGLGQMIALRYGSIPVVRGIGGLIDTVKDYSEDNVNGNGFIFHEFSKVSLLDALIRAISIFEKAEEWQALVKRAMKEDFSWRNSGEQYLNMYRDLLKQG